jgi:hypothetical protein
MLMKSNLLHESAYKKKREREMRSEARVIWVP